MFDFLKPTHGLKIKPDGGTETKLTFKQRIILKLKEYAVYGVMAFGLWLFVGDIMKDNYEANVKETEAKKPKAEISAIKAYNNKQNEIRTFIEKKLTGSEFISVKKEEVENLAYQMLMTKNTNLDISKFDLKPFQNITIKRDLKNGYEGVCLNNECLYFRTFKNGEVKKFNSKEISFFENGQITK